MSTPNLRHETIPGDGVDLHVVRAGTGPPVVLLHGFPEHWVSWRRQIAPLVEAGFSVIVPDLRGYNLSDRPSGRDAYHLRHLVADVRALVHASGEPQAHIVGHDWGGIIAWSFAGLHPELTRKLVILNAPHLDLYLRKVRWPPQMLKSWYVLLFQIPRLPEWLLSRGNYRLVREMFRRSPAPPGVFTEHEIDAYIEALARPGALTAGLDYYRALMRRDALAMGRATRITAPTLVIWGERDPALDAGLLEGLDRVAADVKVHRLPDAGHWVQNEASDEVNRALTSFLSAAP